MAHYMVHYITPHASATLLAQNSPGLARTQNYIHKFQFRVVRYIYISFFSNKTPEGQKGPTEAPLLAHIKRRMGTADDTANGGYLCSEGVDDSPLFCLFSRAIESCRSMGSTIFWSCEMSEQLWFASALLAGSSRATGAILAEAPSVRPWPTVRVPSLQVQG